MDNNTTTRSNIYFILYPHNIVVEGKERAAIYDLQHNSVIPVPSILAMVIRDFRSLTVQELIDKVSPSDPEVLYKYLHFLESKNLGFYTDDVDQFPEMNLEWHSPTRIQNAILEYDPSAYNIVQVLGQLDTLLCRQVEIRIEKDCFTEEMALSAADALRGKIFRSAQLIIGYNDLVTAELIKLICDRCNKISSVLVHGAPEDHHFTYNKAEVGFCTEDFNSVRYKTPFSDRKYIVNLTYFTEALAYNTYYNQKVCINKQGFIMNSLTNQRHFGNINERMIDDVLDNTDFKVLWYVNADRIFEYKDSELRYCMFINNDLQQRPDGFYEIVNS